LGKILGHFFRKRIWSPCAPLKRLVRISINEGALRSNADIQIADRQNVNRQNVNCQNADIQIADRQNVGNMTEDVYFSSPLLTGVRCPPQGLGDS
jgi:hypothetical protein